MAALDVLLFRKDVIRLSRKGLREYEDNTSAETGTFGGFFHDGDDDGDG